MGVGTVRVHPEGLLRCGVELQLYLDLWSRGQYTLFTPVIVGTKGGIY